MNLNIQVMKTKSQPIHPGARVIMMNNVIPGYIYMALHSVCTMHIFAHQIIEGKRLMESVGFVDGSFDLNRLDMLLDVCAKGLIEIRGLDLSNLFRMNPRHRIFSLPLVKLEVKAALTEFILGLARFAETLQLLSLKTRSAHNQARHANDMASIGGVFANNHFGSLTHLKVFLDNGVGHFIGPDDQVNAESTLNSIVSSAPQLVHFEFIGPGTSFPSLAGILQLLNRRRPSKLTVFRLWLRWINAEDHCPQLFQKPDFLPALRRFDYSAYTKTEMNVLREIHQVRPQLLMRLRWLRYGWTTSVLGGSGIPPPLDIWDGMG